MRRTMLLAAAAATTALTVASGASAQSYGQGYGSYQGSGSYQGYGSQNSGSYQGGYNGGYQSGYQQPAYGQGGYDNRYQGGYDNRYQGGYDNRAQGGYQGGYQNSYPNSGYDNGYRQPYSTPQGRYAPAPTYSDRSYDTDASRAPTGGSLASIFSCDASGGKQATGAVIGGIAGALLGRSLAKGNRSLGTGLGAAIGAGAGSYIGCKMQRDDVERATYATNQALTYGRAQTWRNDQTGAYGTVNVYADNPRYAQAYGGNDCRIVDQNFTTRSGGSQTERFRACRTGSDWTYTRL